MVPRPCALLSSRRSCSSLIDSCVGLTCWALTGAASPASISTTIAATRIRIRAISLVMVLISVRSSPPAGAGNTPNGAPANVRASSRRDGLTIGNLPAPGAGAVAALGDALLVDLRDDLAVAGQERLGRAHLGAQRQLAFCQPIGA